MASDKIKCVFCKGHNDKIILFEGDKLKKCQQVLSVRVKYKLKYSDIELPTQINKTDGYHRQCYSSCTALMAKYRDSSSETDYASNSTSLTLSPSTPVDISETVPRNVTQSSCSEVASSSLNIQTKSGDFELNLNSKITPEDVAPSSNNQSISRHPDLDFNCEISKNAALNLDSQTTLEDVASSSTCDLSINETNVFNEIPDTNIEDIGKERQLKNVCFFCDKDRKQNKGKQQNLYSSNDAKLYDKIIEWMEKLNNEELLQKIHRLKSENKTIFYHHLCELNYLNDYNKIISDIPHTSWHKNRNIHKYIFNHIVSTVEEEVLQKKIVYCYHLSAIRTIIIWNMSRN